MDQSPHHREEATAAIDRSIRGSSVDRSIRFAVPEDDDREIIKRKIGLLDDAGVGEALETAIGWDG